MTEIQQLQRRLAEQVLNRAAADPEWRRQLLDDPGAAAANFPEAQRLREMYESATPTEAPPDAMPTQEEEYRQLSRSLWEKVLDKATSDPLWKQQLLDDPEATLRAANFPELKRVEEMRQSAQASREAEAVGHVMIDPYRYTSVQQGYCCAFYTLGQTKY